jgi:hypothetical protein
LGKFYNSLVQTGYNMYRNSKRYNKMYKLSINGTEEEMQDTSLESMQKTVGGYIEIVYLPDGRMMVVDEEGLLKNKDLNIVASQLAGQQIVGDVIIAENGEIT